MKKRHVKGDPAHSATLRRPVLAYSSSGVEVVGYVLRSTGEPCDEQNKPVAKAQPVITADKRTKKVDE